MHIYTLIYISNYVGLLESKDPDIDLDARFSPSLLNSAVYLLQLSQQVSTFAVNYQGKPHRESIRENRYMFWGLLGVGAIAFSCATEFIPEINEQLKLVKFTVEFKWILTFVMLLDFCLSWLIETGFMHFFMDFKPKDIAKRPIKSVNGRA